MKLIILFFLFLFLASGFSQNYQINDLKTTIILISLDGFHPSYLERNKDGNLNSIGREGVQAKWMIPVFPSKTFPNHYSIATGLYSEHHGIIPCMIRFLKPYLAHVNVRKFKTHAGGRVNLFGLLLKKWYKSCILFFPWY